MKLRLIIGLVIVLLASPVQAQLFRVPSGASRTLVQASWESLKHMAAIEESVVKQMYTLARNNFRSEKNLLANVSSGLVQIKMPDNSQRILGTGFLFEQDGHLFVGMAHHVGKDPGSVRKVEVFNQQGQKREYEVTIVAGGNSGWHASDMSIAELPREALAYGAQPLPLGEPDLAAPVFSLGYTSGRILEQQDFLPLRGKLLSAEGYNLQGTRELIVGEDVDRPFLFSGYCGSPLVQLQEGLWKVVGMCAGGCVTRGVPSGNRTFAVNLTKTLPPLVDSYISQVPPPSRGLYFRGWDVDRLSWREQVERVQVIRGESVLFEQELHRYPSPYSDERSEMVLEDFPTRSGDVICYTIRVSRTQTRQVQFTIP